MNIKHLLTCTASALLLLTVTAAKAHTDCADIPGQIKAPHSLAGYDMVLQIEHATSVYPSGYPSKGAVVKRYNRDGKFTAQGTGILQPDTPAEQQYFFGTYKYHRTGSNSGTEQSVDVALGNVPFSVKYVFTSATSGTWEEDFDQGKLKLSGSFTLVPSNLPLAQHMAPANIANMTVALVIKSTESGLPAEVYPDKGLVLQSYAIDGSVLLKGYGPRTVDSTGTYKYTKIAPHTAVEEVNQMSQTFTMPYTMVYNFDTPNSGSWFQNFGDGLIIFRGVFNLFPSK